MGMGLFFLSLVPLPLFPPLSPLLSFLFFLFPSFPHSLCVFSPVPLFVTPWTVAHSPPGSSVREILQARILE